MNSKKVSAAARCSVPFVAAEVTRRIFTSAQESASSRRRLRSESRLRAALLFSLLAITAPNFLRAAESGASVAIVYNRRVRDSRPIAEHYAEKRNVPASQIFALDLPEGEFVALLGPSGCGKTTLLRMLAGFETPNSGRILLDGADIAEVPPHKRPVNMMFQSYALFPHLDCTDNVAFSLALATAAASANAQVPGVAVFDAANARDLSAHVEVREL